jgi:hypothetical protein
LFQVISILPRYLLLALGDLPLLAPDVRAQTSHLLVLYRVLLLFIVFQAVLLVSSNLLRTSDAHIILLVNHAADSILGIICRIGYYVGLGRLHDILPCWIVDALELVVHASGHLLLLLDQKHLLLHHRQLLLELGLVLQHLLLGNRLVHLLKLLKLTSVKDPIGTVVPRHP